MAEFKEQNNLFGGMNSDDVSRRAPKGDYRVARNIRKKGGVIQNLKGTVELLTEMAPGNYKTIAAYDNLENGQVYEFIYDASEAENHMILRFDRATNSRAVITAGPWLKFTPRPLMVDMIGNSLIFANEDNPPREIDVVKLEANQVPLSEFNLSFIRYAPTRPLITRFDSQTPTSVNEINNNSYQFAHRYLYKDGSKSTFGPYTAFIHSYSDGSVSILNKIDLEIIPDIFGASSDQVELEIDEVEIAVRNSSIGNFRIIARLPITQTEYSFTNESELGPVPVSEVSKPYDSVPLLAKDVEISGSRVYLGGNTEDFPEVTDFAIESPVVYIHDMGDIMTSNPYAPGVWPPSAADLRERLNGQNMGFKVNSKYQLCIIFHEEAGRAPLAYTNKSLLFDTKSNIFSNRSASFGFKFPSSFKPPIWANTYSIGRSEALKESFFIQGYTNNTQYRKITGLDADGLEIYADCAPADASLLNLNISNFYRPTKKSVSAGNPGSGLYYNFQEGDRVRVSGTDIDSRIVTFAENNIVLNASDFGARSLSVGSSYTIEIYREKAINTDGIIFYEIGETYPILDAKTEDRAWSKSDWTFTGMAAVTDEYFNNFPVIGGDVYNQEKTFYFDYKPDTTYSISLNIQSMSQIPGREYGSWDHSNGRPWVAHQTKPSTKILETQVRFGGLLVPESRVNNLFSFYEFDQYIYPLEYGPLTKLVTAFDYAGAESGDVMLAVFKNTAISIYIGKSTIQTTDGDQQVGLSDKVLGSYNVLDGGYGSVNPESFTNYKGRVWYWCQEVKGWIRYAQNGLLNLSRVKMMEHFESLSSTEVRSMYDFRNEELVCKHDFQTIVFSEDEDFKRWQAIYNYDDCHILLPGLAFKGERVSLLEANADRNTFFGFKYNSEIEPMLCEPGTESKVLQTVDVDSNYAWFPVTVKTESELETTGTLNKMIQKEWLWSAEIGFHAGTEKKMRSRSFTILLRLDPSVTEQALLYDLFINYSHSKPQTAK